MRQRADIIAILIVILIIAVAIGVLGRPKNSQAITDVSWPNCKTKSDTDYNEGIIGVTGGLDFRPNPCLDNEKHWYSRYALYINTGYPGIAYGKKYRFYPLHCSIKQKGCIAYDYGYAATEYALGVASKNGVHSYLWWLDVETDNSWTNTTAINKASLKGNIAAILNSNVRNEVGIYSTPDQWQAITGGWHNNLPLWVGTGLTSKGGAANECGAAAFTGGQIWLIQYLAKIDTNVSCSNAFPNQLLAQEKYLAGYSRWSH